jgi:hypothetical protein
VIGTGGVVSTIFRGDRTTLTITTWRDQSALSPLQFFHTGQSQSSLEFPCSFPPFEEENFALGSTLFAS